MAVELVPNADARKPIALDASPCARDRRAAAKLSVPRARAPTPIAVAAVSPTTEA